MAGQFRIELLQEDGSWKTYQHPNQKPLSRWPTITKAAYNFRSQIKKGTARVAKDIDNG